MPLFLLIRHGETDYVKTGRLAGRLPNVHLNEKGRKQAQALAEHIKGAPIKALYSSPMERALETATPLAQVLGLPIVVRPGFLETDIGEWMDQPVKSLTRLKIWKTVTTAPSRMHFPGGENFSQTQSRIVQELESLLHQHDPKDMVVCVSHADPIKLAVAYFLGIPLDLFQRLTIGTASITTLHLSETGNQLVSLNIDPSLPFPRR